MNTPAVSTALLQLGTVLKDRGYDFVTISRPSHRRVNARPGNATASDLRGVFGWNRPFRTDLLDTALLDLMRQAGILRERDGELRSGLRASTIDGRLYFHSSSPTDEDDAVFFGPDTYRYVQLLRTALAALPAPRRVVDIGCGAGPGVLSVAAMAPDAEVWGVDINQKALALAAVNAALAGASNVHLVRSDLLDNVEGQFDLVISNPPFMLDASKLAYRHGGGALGEGLSLAIVEAAIERLAPGGALVLYTCVAIVDGTDPFRERATGMLSTAGLSWEYREIDPDVFGGELSDEAHAHTDRLAAVALIARRATS